MGVLIALWLLLVGLFLLIDLIVHTAWLSLLTVFLIGIVVGRVYEAMKRRYPANLDLVRTREAKARTERLRAEVEVERERAKLDAELDKRIKR